MSPSLESNATNSFCYALFYNIKFPRPTPTQLISYPAYPAPPESPGIAGVKMYLPLREERSKLRRIDLTIHQ